MALVETLLAADCESHNVRNLVNKAVVQIKVVGASDPLLITCSSVEMAESIADLIDRYCRLVNGTTVSLWNKRGNIFCSFLPKFSLMKLSTSALQAPPYKYYGCPCYHGKNVHTVQYLFETC